MEEHKVSEFNISSELDILPKIEYIGEVVAEHPSNQIYCWGQIFIPDDEHKVWNADHTKFIQGPGITSSYKGDQLILHKLNKLHVYDENFERTIVEAQLEAFKFSFYSKDKLAYMVRRNRGQNNWRLFILYENRKIQLDFEKQLISFCLRDSELFYIDKNVKSGSSKILRYDIITGATTEEVDIEYHERDHEDI